jgi:hypothetical protein
MEVKLCALKGRHSTEDTRKISLKKKCNSFTKEKVVSNQKYSSLELSTGL